MTVATKRSPTPKRRGRQQEGPVHPVVSVQRRNREGRQLEDYLRCEATGDHDEDVRMALERIIADPDSCRLTIERTNRPKQRQRSTSAVVVPEDDDA